jgi:hypothetical protein
LGNKTCGRAGIQFKDEEVCSNFLRGNPGSHKRGANPGKA